MQNVDRVATLLAEMTLPEKIGQMQQANGALPDCIPLIRSGQVGSLLNMTAANLPNPARIANDFQRVAVEESRLGIPLIFGRDVIHGFRTVFPIPLGQAASFNPTLVEEGAKIAAREAAACGYNWTFAPMVDVSRDARWGRIAESAGEDTLLNARMGAAMVRGFQGEDLSHPEHIAACAKHYVGYGAAEGGRDYNSTWIPENLLRDVYLPSFHACVQAGVATVMSAFNNLNGVPASGNCLTLRQILKGEWAFNGFVVSDWDSIAEMIAHGYCAGRREAALAGIGAGVDMEMVSTCYAEYAQMLIDEGVLAISTIDETVSRILDVKLRLGLFEHPYVEEDRLSVLVSVPHLDTARRLATESCVLLKNDGVLPLAPEIKSLAVIGPLADAPAEQLGCWVADGMPEDSITPLRALHQVLAGRCSVAYAAGLPDARSTDQQGFAEAVSVAASCDAVVLFLGEDAALSGEAHSRAFIDLPGAQEALVQAISACGKPLVAVIMAGRPLTLSQVLESLPAILYAWHPGIMAGPAIADLLLGKVSPSGKLPVSYPRTVGQMPLYYAQANTGRPTPKEHVAPTGTPLNPIGFTSTYLDVDHRPEFPFGFGLSYTTFSYQTLTLSSSTVSPGESLTVSAIVTNTGNMAADEVVQLYTRDLVGSLVRPVKELKDFTRIHLAAGESRRISFNLHTDQLAFHNVDMQLVTEPGEFQVFVGGDSETELMATFTVT